MTVGKIALTKELGMPMNRQIPDKIVTSLRQVELEIPGGKTGAKPPGIIMVQANHRWRRSGR